MHHIDLIGKQHLAVPALSIPAHFEIVAVIHVEALRPAGDGNLVPAQDAGEQRGDLRSGKRRHAPLRRELHVAHRKLPDLPLGTAHEELQDALVLRHSTQDDAIVGTLNPRWTWDAIRRLVVENRGASRLPIHAHIAGLDGAIAGVDIARAPNRRQDVRVQRLRTHTVRAELSATLLSSKGHRWQPHDCHCE